MTAFELSLLEQRSPLWIQARVGLVTASRCADVIACLQSGKSKGQEKAERRNYRTELICERLTGQPYPHYVSAEMQWGLDQEPFARAAYELQNDVLVDTVGFVPHPTIALFGCSPDGYVGDKGMVQFKCPNTTTHLGWMLSGVIPVEHVPQLLGELACNPEREWIDFASFDPRLPEHLQLWVRRFARNEKLISGLEAEVVHFNYEIDETLATLPQKPQGVVISMDRNDPEEVQL